MQLLLLDSNSVGDLSQFILLSKVSDSSEAAFAESSLRNPCVVSVIIVYIRVGQENAAVFCIREVRVANESPTKLCESPSERLNSVSGSQILCVDAHEYGLSWRLGHAKFDL